MQGSRVPHVRHGFINEQSHIECNIKVWHVSVAAVVKGQREHGSVEMRDGWTMSFP